MAVLVAGTLCLDTIETPHGQVERVLGGSAAYAAVAAALSAPVRLVGPVGADFPPEHLTFLAGRGIDLAGVGRVPEVRSQFWHGRYHPGLRTREHVAVDNAILDRWQPVLPDHYRDSRFVFLAHMPPRLQLAVLDQLRGPHFVLADTIDYWILTRRPELEQVLARVDAFVLNDEEARLLTGEANIARAARLIRGYGPRFVLIKRGEDGAYVDDGQAGVSLPACMAARVTDTTGAGDTFAGALVGRLGEPAAVDRTDLIRAAAFGAAAASFTVEDFGLTGLARATPAAIEARLARTSLASLVSPVPPGG